MFPRATPRSRPSSTSACATPDGLLIGGFGSDPPGASFVPWFYVDGIEAAVERVTANGGRVVEPVRDEGDIRLGLWQFPKRGVRKMWP